MRTLVLLVAVTAIAGAGCGKKANKQIPVTGMVTLDGEPVAGAMLVFMPCEDSPGQGGYARTANDGRFEVKHDLNGPGLVPGTYNVTISSGPPLMDGNTGEAPAPPPKKFPGKYGDPKATPFARIAVEPGKTIELPMLSEGSK